MARPKGKPLVKHKNVGKQVRFTRIAWSKVVAAEKRLHLGKSRRSDVVNECVMQTADTISRETFAKELAETLAEEKVAAG